MSAPTPQASPFLRTVPLTDGGAIFVDPIGGNRIEVTAELIEPVVQKGILTRELKEALIGGQLMSPDPTVEISKYHEVCRAARIDSEDRASFRLGFLTDELNEVQMHRAISATLDEIAKRPIGKIFLHLWAFTVDGFHRLPKLLEKLADVLETRESGLTLTLDAGLTIDAAIERTFERLSVLSCDDRQVTVLFHRTAMESAGGARAYSAQAFAWQSLLFRHKFAPAFIFLVGPDDVEAIGIELFEEICFSGIYPRNLHMNFVNATPERATLGCEMHGIDHALLRRAIGEVMARPTHGILEPLSLGYGQALMGAITQDDIWPRTSFCPFTRPSMIFGGDNAGQCPVAVAKATMGQTQWDQLLWDPVTPDRAKQDAWVSRGPHTIEQCSGCNAAALCGSGCPLRAFETTGSLNAPDCPPVSELDHAVGTFASRLLERRRG